MFGIGFHYGCKIFRFKVYHFLFFLNIEIMKNGSNGLIIIIMKFIFCFDSFYLFLNNVSIFILHCFMKLIKFACLSDGWNWTINIFFVHIVSTNCSLCLVIKITFNWFMLIRYSSSLIYFSFILLFVCSSACLLRYSEYYFLLYDVGFSRNRFPMTAYEAYYGFVLLSFWAFQWWFSTCLLSVCFI